MPETIGNKITTGLVENPAEWIPVTGTGMTVAGVFDPHAITRPAALQFHLNGFHNPIRLRQDFDDFLIMAHLIKGQGATLAVLEPFLRRLIATDIEVPGNLRDIGKAVGFIDEYRAGGSGAAGGVVNGNKFRPVDHIVAFDIKGKGFSPVASKCVTSVSYKD